MGYLAIFRTRYNYTKAFHGVRTCIIFIFLFCITSKSIAAPINITLWHSMAGSFGEVVNKIVQEFNQSQHQYKVIPIYKGSYPETLVALVAAFRAGEQPAVAQVFEVGTAMMTNPPGAIVPLYKLMEQTNTQPIASKDLLPAIGSYYSNSKGQLLAMPFNSSTPVLFYNKSAFIKAGLSSDNPPKTWSELEYVASKLIKAGYPCGFTTAWPSWIQLEAFSAWHNLPFASQDNGFRGINVKLTFNNPAVIQHIAQLASWQQHNNLFVYGGREDNALALFTSQKCPIIMESSGSLIDLTQSAGFPVGVGPIPYWSDRKGAPQNMLIGGAALWAMAGQSQNKYKGVAEFFKFLAKPKIQMEFQQATGYLPVTQQAKKLSEQQGYFKKYPGAKIAINELINKQPTMYSRGIRLGAYPQIRNINNEALEAIFSGKRTAKQGLDEAVNRGNEVLKQFANNIS